MLRTILRERLTRLHAPGPAWAASTGQLRYESVEQSASDKVDVALSRLLDGAADGVTSAPDGLNPVREAIPPASRGLRAMSDQGVQAARPPAHVGAGAG